MEHTRYGLRENEKKNETGGNQEQNLLKMKHLGNETSRKRNGWIMEQTENEIEKKWLGMN